MESKQDPLAALLGGLIGGQEQSSAGDVGGLIQGLLGGQSGQGLGALAGLVGGGALAQMANALSQRTGLPPAIAQVVVAFVIQKLLGGQSSATTSTTTKPKPSSTKPRPSSTSKPKPSATKPRPSKPKPSQAASEVPDLGGLIGSLIGGGQASSTPAPQQPSGGFDLGSLLTALGGASGKRSLDTSSLAQELAQETGLDEETAARSLQQTMELLVQRGQTAVIDEAASAPARPRRRKAKT